MTIQLLQYNPLNNSIVFNYTLPVGVLVNSITLTHTSGTSQVLNLTSAQLLSGNFSVNIAQYSFNEFKDLFTFNFALNNDSVIVYTIGNLSNYEKCLIDLINKSNLIDCKLVQENACKTFEDKCKNNIYYISTLLASVYRAIECGLVSEANFTLSNIKFNLDCCDCCKDDCDYIYIKNNKYAPYHYFDNEPDPEVIVNTECEPITFQINGQTIETINYGTTYNMIIVNSDNEQIGNFTYNSTSNTLIFTPFETNFNINNITYIPIECGSGYSLQLVNHLNQPITGVYDSEAHTYTIDTSCESPTFNFMVFANWEELEVEDEEDFISFILDNSNYQNVTVQNFILQNNLLQCNIIATNPLVSNGLLNLSNKGITNVYAIQGFSNLVILNLSNNSIYNFNPILSLPNTLQTLILTANIMTSFNPSLILPISLQNLLIPFNLINSAGWTISEQWATLQTSFTSPCNIFTANNVNTSIGTNFETVINTKNAVIVN
jgi:hypothetical protein